MMCTNIYLQTRHNQYGLATNTSHTDKEKDSIQVEEHFHLLRLDINDIAKIPKVPLCCLVNNPNGCETPIYIVLWMTWLIP